MARNTKFPTHSACKVLEAYSASHGKASACLAWPKPRSRKRTYSYRIASMKTLRFLFVHHAARLTRISGRKVLRFSANPATETIYHHIAGRFAA